MSEISQIENFSLTLYFISFRTFNHPNIVKCHGMSIESSYNQDENMAIFMEVCECSLADVFLCDKHPMEMCKCDPHRRQSCHSFSGKARNCQEYFDAFAHFTKMFKDILNGLLYLHNIGCTHRGLKLSNILVGIFSFFFDGCDLYTYTWYIYVAFKKCCTCFNKSSVKTTLKFWIWFMSNDMKKIHYFRYRKCIFSFIFVHSSSCQKR